MGSEIIGQVILNRYRVDSFLEAGGMGVVYRVWDLARNVPLAMKVLHDDFNNDESIFKMFQREADSLTKLTHPHIVPFYGFYQTPDYAFFLERYIDGPSLKRLLHERRGKPLDVASAIIFLKALCAALGYAHVNGLVHCDIKPGNVLIDQGGNIYLTDFGVARHSLSTATTMASAGTPAYMAPEQIRGEPVSAETDIYALGTLLFEMLTGRRPFLGNEPESEEYGPSTDQRIYYAQMNINPANPARLNPAIPIPLSQVILKALSKDPGQRFHTTQELFQAICQATGVQAEAVADHISSESVSGSGLRTASVTMPPAPPSATPIPAVQPQPSEPFRPDTAPQAQKRNWAARNTPLLVIAGAVLLCIVSVTVGLVGANLLRTKPRLGGIDTQPTVTIENVVAAAPPVIQESPTSTPTQANRPKITQASTQTFTAIPLAPFLTRTQKPAILSQTATPKLVEFNAPLYQPIPGCASSHIHTKNWVMITLGGGRNAIRSTADTHPTDNKIGFAEPGELIYVIDGPVCNYGWLLWKVKTATGLEGWTPETDGKRFFLEPFPSWDACPDSSPSLLHKGDNAQVTQFPPVSNRVRVKPGINEERTGTLQPGEKLLVIDGPQCADGFVWWNVRSESGTSGWTAEGKGQEYYLVPVPEPHP